MSHTILYTYAFSYLPIYEKKEKEKKINIKRLVALYR